MKIIKKREIKEEKEKVTEGEKLEKKKKNKKEERTTMLLLLPVLLVGAFALYHFVIIFRGNSPDLDPRDKVFVVTGNVFELES